MSSHRIWRSNVIRYVEKLMSALGHLQPELTVSDSGSFYISLIGSKVRQIRVSNHSGHKLKRNVWELRSDAMTSRKKPFNRVYNIKDINVLISELRR